MMPNPPGGVPPQQPCPGAAPQSFHYQERVSGKDGNGVHRGGVFLLRASAARRWWARIIDAAIVVALFGAVVAALLVSGETVQLSDSAAGLTMFAAYPVLLLVLGALYGCTCSPGQALTGVVSLRCHSGKRVGFWRGMFRYLGIGLLPITAVLALGSLLDLPTFNDEEVRVYRRCDGGCVG